MARVDRAQRRRGVRYRWRPALPGDSLTDVCAAVAAGWLVAMLIGAAIPRHWVLLTELDTAALHCYEPSAGAVVPVPPAAIREARIAGLGYPARWPSWCPTSRGEPQGFSAARAGMRPR